MNATVPRLFRPGDGAPPPALAGRKVQQAVLSRCLADLVAGTAPPHNVVLLGPRGNGKTALLNWFQGVCGAAPVDVAALTPDHIPSHQALADALIPRRGIARWLPRKISVDSAASAERRSEGAANPDLVRALTARCSPRPASTMPTPAFSNSGP